MNRWTTPLLWLAIVALVAEGARAQVAVRAKKIYTMAGAPLEDGIVAFDPAGFRYFGLPLARDNWRFFRWLLIPPLLLAVLIGLCRAWRRRTPSAPAPG